MYTWTKNADVPTTLEQWFLRNMNKTSLDEVNEMFVKRRSGGYKISKLTEAVNFTLSDKARPVRVMGDYDCDGVTSTSIMVLALKAAGFKNVSYDIPRRFSEGYGLNLAMVERMPENALVITVDNGISAIEPLSAAKAKGASIIILDHHLAGVDDNGNTVLPEADYIIDPEALPGSADYDGYCGAGLAFRFAEDMLCGENADPKYDRNSALIKMLEALAAVGTVADVMKLTEENYVIVREGLSLLKYPSTMTAGLAELVKRLNLGGHICAKDIAFSIGPTVNAASRMKDDGALDAVKVLSFTGKQEEIAPLVNELIARNGARKTARDEALAKADEILSETDVRAPLVVVLPGVPEGVIGPVAGTLAEEYSMPAFVLTTTGDGVLRGSARTFGSYNIKENLDNVKPLLLKYGGHAGAAGLSLEEGNVAAFTEALQNTYTGAGEVPAEIMYDYEISAAEEPANEAELAKYEPWGEGNPLPVFKVTGMTVIPTGGHRVSVINDRVKLYGPNDLVASGYRLKGLTEELGEPLSVDVVGPISTRYWMGKESHNIDMLDAKPHKAEMKRTALAAMLAGMCD